MVGGEAWQGVEREPLGLGRVVPAQYRPAHPPNAKGYGHDVPARISRRVGVDPRQAFHDGPQPGLLLHLADHRRLAALADLDEASRKGPHALPGRTSASDQKDLPADDEHPIDGESGRFERPKMEVRGPGVRT